MAPLRRDFAPWIGLAAGAALYAANLRGFTALFPWFEELRSADTLAAQSFRDNARR